MIDRVDIGGGTTPASGYANLDPHHGKGKWRRRLQDGIPRPDCSLTTVRASHVMEHIPAGKDRIDAFNEVWRVLVPGGTFEIVVPLVGVNGRLVEGWWPYADPTHVSFWYFPESWLYFCEGPRKPNADYGIRLWQALRRDEDMHVVDGWEGYVTLRKPEKAAGGDGVVYQ